jgi:hypothetical protein
MYQKILSDIQQDYYQQYYSNDGQRFVAWYLRNIHCRNEIETKSDITDGADDKQIDAIYVDDRNSTVYIIQGKFIGKDSVDAEPLREVLSSWVQLKNLVKLQENANDKLKQKLSEVAIAFDDNYDVEFELITTASLTDAAKNDLAVFQKELAESHDLLANIRLVDADELKSRHEATVEPVLKHSLFLQADKYIKMQLAETSVILAVLPLKDCLSFPGIKDGTLFQKNVRQSLGLSNQVNKGLKDSIYKDAGDFFFYHNGITILCNKIELNEATKELSLKGLSVVNGCQSLNTILSCSEKVKTLTDAYIMCRFYEIPQNERADKISVSTNSQSAVKPRDLRSNDKRVLALKASFEQKYRSGYLKTKRGEDPFVNKDRGYVDKNYVIDLSDLAKYLVSWHSQRPNLAYGETKLFDKYFDQLFKNNYAPENALALQNWMQLVWKKWEKDNPLNLNESLLAMRAYAPYHHLYAISICFSEINNVSSGIPNPYTAYEKAKKFSLNEQIVDISGTCLNSALEAAANEPLPNNRVFSPQNWIKTKTCLTGIKMAISQYFRMLPSIPGGRELSQTLKSQIKMDASEYEERWTAD